MSKKSLEVSDNVVVTLEYILTLDDGEEIDRSTAEEPLQFLQGHGEIIRGLEKALYGMQVGESKEVNVSPSDGYGEYNSSAFETMTRDNFPANMELAEGQELNIRDSETNEIFQASIYEIKQDEVVLDFNHPLAGESLNFSVKVVDLREATTEELSHGHVHGSGGHHH